jgi:hypothetical protein
VALPNRFAEQINYLETHPQVSLVASATHLIDETGSRVGFHPGGLNDCDLKFTFASRNPVIHSTAVFRAEAARQVNGYDEDPQYWFTEDYEFLARLAFHGKACVLPQPLVEYRLHPASVSATNCKDQESQSESVTRSILKRALKWEVDDRCWRAWWRFTWTKPGVAVHFESDEVKLMSRLMLGLLRNLEHDSDGSCALPWYWARHALALAVLRRSPIPIGTRVRFLFLAAEIAMQKLISHS